jgi:hypothetical protein
MQASPKARRVPAERLSDRELARELTLAAGARWTPRKQLFDTLFAELQRRRSRYQ